MSRGSRRVGGCKTDALACHGTLDKPDPYLEMWKGEVRKLGLRGRKRVASSNDP